MINIYIIFYLIFYKLIIFIRSFTMGMGIGDWAPPPNPQSPNPQHPPFPNPLVKLKIKNNI